MHQSIGKKNNVAIYLIFLFILSTTNGKFSVEQKNYSLKIDKINVSGLSNIKNLQIQNDLSDIFYQNIFILKKKEINKVVMKHNIIDKYNIKKIYPSTLNIKIKPTEFLAKLADNNQLIVGSNGKLIYSEFGDKILPLILGEFNSKDFLELKKNVRLSKFNFTEFKSLHFFPSQRWDIITTDDILIRLSKTKVVESLNMAHKIIDSTEFKDKNVIDLRIKNYLIIK